MGIFVAVVFAVAPLRVSYNTQLDGRIRRVGPGTIGGFEYIERATSVAKIVVNHDWDQQLVEISNQGRQPCNGGW